MAGDQKPAIDQIQYIIQVWSFKVSGKTGQYKGWVFDVWDQTFLKNKIVEELWKKMNNFKW